LATLFYIDLLIDMIGKAFFARDRWSVIFKFSETEALDIRSLIVLRLTTNLMKKLIGQSK